jgi:hypothetical protein
MRRQPLTLALLALVLTACSTTAAPTSVAAAGDELGYAALWTDSTKADGGRPTPLTAAWQWLVPRLAKGDVEIGYSTTSPLPAFREGGGALVVNLTGDAVTVSNGTGPIPAWTSATTDVS